MAGKNRLDVLSICTPQTKAEERLGGQLSRLGRKRDRSVSRLVIETVLQYLDRKEKKRRPPRVLRVASTIPSGYQLPPYGELADEGSWYGDVGCTHSRNVSGVQPIFVAIETIVAHWELCSRSCSNTIRTACSRTSGEYLPVLVMSPSSLQKQSPAIPWRFSRHSCSPHAYGVHPVIHPSTSSILG